MCRIRFQNFVVEECFVECGTCTCPTYTCTRRPKNIPRAPKSTQEAPRAPQEHPKRPQEHTKSTQEIPRALQEHPRRRPEPKSNLRASGNRAVEHSLHNRSGPRAAEHSLHTSMFRCTCGLDRPKRHNNALGVVAAVVVRHFAFSNFFCAFCFPLAQV